MQPITKRNLLALATGSLFGAGLAAAGMTDPRKVQAFLDLFGDWDPTLAFVMGGAIIPMAIAWIVAQRRRVSVLGTPLPLEKDREIDAKLVLGSTLFGAGWALAGLCPGPALASLGYGGVGGLVFLIAMLAGMVAAPAAKARLDRLTA